MRTTCPVNGARMWRTHAAAALLVASLPTVVLAVGRDQAQYIGGTHVQGFPTSGPVVQITAMNGNPRINGRFDVRSDVTLTFDAGRWGTLAIPYDTISSLEYGLTVGKRTLAMKGLLLFLTWEVTEQYTKDAHYLLTLGYRDQSGSEQAAVFELGTDLVQPTLEMLERRSGKVVEFLDVGACTRLRSAEECGLGSPAELKGLRKVFLDAPNRYHHELILAELEKEDLGLEIVTDRESAEIILDYAGSWSTDPRCPCEGGRGEVSVVHSTRQRVVLVFTGRKKGIWGKKPAPHFAQTFVAAFKSANSIRNEVR